MSDIVERLRNAHWLSARNALEAADEIERLRAALKAAEIAMNHMGDILNGMDAVTEDDEFIFPAFEQVRAALSGDKHE